MSKVAHVIGNGPRATLYKPARGIKITCNLPPFEVENVYTTCMVDFKMMKAIAEGSVTVPGEWVLGFRPKMWCQQYPNFHMRHAPKIKEFFTDLPKYAMKPGETKGNGYTNFNCGHFAVYYASKRVQAEEIHMYGFDSLFDLDLRSCTDFYLGSDRGASNNVRLANNWRPIWPQMFNDFSNTKYVLHHNHGDLKIDVPDNVEVRVHSKK